MKKLILISFVIFAIGCKKDCELVDKAGNPIKYDKKAYREYVNKGQTNINGKTYYLASNDLVEVCN